MPVSQTFCGARAAELPARQKLVVATVSTPIGGLRLVTGSHGLCAAEFADREDRLVVSLNRRWRAGGYHLVRGRAPRDVRTALEAYFAGELAAIGTLEIDLTGTAFQRAIWTRLRTIRPGSTLSYAAMAAAVGRPAAVRATGHANGANPVSVVIPCHRLVGADGSLTGYGGGLDRKRWLLAHEARHRVPGGG
jgi:methylated-DNA-[protein]-cysteine S-methyltransferase